MTTTRQIMYKVKVVYPDGYTTFVWSLTFNAGVYFKRFMQLRGAKEVTIEPEN